MFSEARDTLPPRPLPEAQLMELVHRLQYCRPDQNFTPGDAVIERPGVGNTRPDLRHSYVQVFVRYLDRLQHQDREILAAAVRGWGHTSPFPGFDCIVAQLPDSGTTIVFETHFSGFLRLRTPEDGHPCAGGAGA